MNIVHKSRKERFFKHSIYKKVCVHTAHCNHIYICATHHVLDRVIYAKNRSNIKVSITYCQQQQQQEKHTHKQNVALFVQAPQ